MVPCGAVVRTLCRAVVTLFMTARCGDATAEPAVLEPDKCKGWFWATVADVCNSSIPLFMPLDKLMARAEDFPVLFSDARGS